MTVEGDGDVHAPARDEALEAVLWTAAEVLDVSAAAVGLVDDDWAWRQASVGLDLGDPRQRSFCQRVVAEGAVLVVPDAHEDPLMAKGAGAPDPALRMWAGTPLVTADGQPLGALLVADRRPRELTGTEQATLDALAQLASARIELTAGQRRTEGLVRAGADVLALMAAGAPLVDTVTAVARLVERHAGVAEVTIQVVGDDGEPVVAGTAPPLPTGLVEALGGRGGRRRGALFAEGRHERRTVVVEDIRVTEVGERYRALVTGHGFRSVWALPVESARNGRLLGIMTMYGRAPGAPSADQRQVIAQAGDLAAIAIEGRATEDELARQTSFDALTGLPNRATLLQRLDEALERARRDRSETGPGPARPAGGSRVDNRSGPPAGQGKVAVLMVDLDRFKLVNDRLGHERADGILVAVGARLQAAVRPGDVVARFGADEFVVVCEGLLGEVESMGVAERLIGAVSEPMEVGGESTVLTASVGIAVAHSPDQPADALLRDADTAMYRAKERGRDRCEVFTAATRRRALDRADTERRLRGALSRDELRVWYQPAVALPGGEVIGYEALVRWDDPDRGLVLPAQFVAVAEETGMIVPIGDWVLRQACSQARSWLDGGHRRFGPAFTMAVNLSARQLQHPRLATSVKEAIEDAGIDPAMLCLEITESVLMDDAEASITAVCQLKELGVEIAIDDFGTGFSSLSYLRELPVDVIKVDRSFVAGLGRAHQDEAIVAAVIGMADAFGLRTVAEGVETDVQRRQLVRLACDAAQGFFFGRPSPSAA